MKTDILSGPLAGRASRAGGCSWREWGCSRDLARQSGWAGRRERGARLPSLWSGDHRFSLRGRRQVTCQIWRRWLEAGYRDQGRPEQEQMPGAEEGLNAYREERRTRTKNITNH